MDLGDLFAIMLVGAIAGWCPMSALPLMTAC